MIDTAVIVIAGLTTTASLVTAGAAIYIAIKVKGYTRKYY